MRVEDKVRLEKSMGLGEDGVAKNAAGKSSSQVNTRETFLGSRKGSLAPRRLESRVNNIFKFYI